MTLMFMATRRKKEEMERTRIAIIDMEVIEKEVIEEE